MLWSAGRGGRVFSSSYRIKVAATSANPRPAAPITEKASPGSSAPRPRPFSGLGQRNAGIRSPAEGGEPPAATPRIQPPKTERPLGEGDRWGGCRWEGSHCPGHPPTIPTAATAQACPLLLPSRVGGHIGSPSLKMKVLTPGHREPLAVRSEPSYFVERFEGKTSTHLLRRCPRAAPFPSPAQAVRG